MNKMANHSYLKDRLGFDPDELMNEVDELFQNDPEVDDLVSPTHKKFKSYKPSPSSSTSSVRDNYEHALSNVKGKEENKLKFVGDESVKERLIA